VPGAPAPAGVPFDRVSEIEAELAPVFSLLDAAQRDATELTEQSTQRAALRRSEAAEHARRILLHARSDAEAARAESAAVGLARADDQRRAIVEGARAEAQRIDRTSAEQRPSLVEEVVRRVLAMGKNTSAISSGPTTTPGS